MILYLDEAMNASADNLDALPIPFSKQVSKDILSHLYMNISPEDFAVLSADCTTWMQLAKIYNCDPCTIRRQLLEYGISRPGSPVYTNKVNPDGNIIKTYHSGISSKLSNITNMELDTIMLEIHQQFLSFGQRMIGGYLMQLDHQVLQSCLLDLYHQVVGSSPHIFGPCCLQRQVYSVPGPHSLWHHNGQHGGFFHFYLLLMSNIIQD